MTTNQEKWNAVDLMRRQGGSFAKALAAAWCFADKENREKIETAFSALFAEYINNAKRIKNETVS